MKWDTIGVTGQHDEVGHNGVTGNNDEMGRSGVSGHNDVMGYKWIFGTKIMLRDARIK